MAFAGSLEDLAIPDVLQLLHVSRKTGVLRVHGPDERRAVLRLREGAIIGANHPAKEVTVGSILRELGAVREADVEALVAQEADAERGREPLVAKLVNAGLIDRAAGYRALERLIEETVIEILGWHAGAFDFDVDENPGCDEFSHIPDAVTEAVSLDTQAALMDALRIIDERNHARSRAARQVEARAAEEAARVAAPGGGSGEASALAPPDAGDTLAEAPRVAAPAQSSADGSVAVAPSATEISRAAPVPSSSPPSAPGTEEDRLLATLDTAALPARMHAKALLFSPDGFVKLTLRDLGAQAGIDVFTSEFVPDHLRRLEATTPDAEPPVLVVDVAGCEHLADMRRGAARLLEQARARFPEVPLVVLTEPEAQARAYELGATTVLARAPRDAPRSAYVATTQQLVTTLVACLGGIFARRVAMGRRPLDCRRQMAILKQRANEIRYNHASSEISLVVLRYVAEIFERCVIFLVRRDDLLGLGAFGLDAGADAASVLRLKIPLAAGSIFHDVVTHGRLVHGASDDPSLHAHLYERIGAPNKPDTVLLPLRAEQRTAALIYADFGLREAAPVETDALEILANQAGLALELALLRGRAPHT